MIAIKVINKFNNINKRNIINNIIVPLSLSSSSSTTTTSSSCTYNKILNTKYIRRNLSTVSAQTIHITFVDLEGNRARVPALVGQTLLQVAQRHKVDLEGACDGGGSPIEVKRLKIGLNQHLVKDQHAFIVMFKSQNHFIIYYLIKQVKKLVD